MKGFSYAINRIEEQLTADVNINTVTNGRRDEIALDNKVIYPLAHIMVNTINPLEIVNTMSVTLSVIDLVFPDNSNSNDVFNSLATVVNRLIESLRRGQMHDDYFELQSVTPMTRIDDQFTHKVNGWEVTFDFAIHNDTGIE